MAVDRRGSWGRPTGRVVDRPSLKRDSVKLACLILTGIVSAGGIAWAQGPPLLERYKCYFCHADREAKTGPAFADIAARYKGKPQAMATLAAAVRNGRHGDGPWHMPPHPEVSEADAKKMVRYILSLKE
jgi:cytochrome c